MRGPRNRFALVDASHVLLIAGGIGITPIVAMARALAERGASFRLIYGARNEASFAFRPELVQLCGPNALLVAEDVHGRPDLAGELAAAPADTAVFACGPEPMLAVVDELCAARPDLDLHVERFAGSGTVETLRPDDGSFEIVLKRTGTVVVVPPDRTALDVVREVVPGHPYSCMEGECGSCEVRVLEGEIDHRDEVLSPQERLGNTAMMLCVSRATSDRVVIDL